MIIKKENTSEDLHTVESQKQLDVVLKCQVLELGLYLRF